jgi:hypothetical protein
LNPLKAAFSLSSVGGGFHTELEQKIDKQHDDGITGCDIAGHVGQLL